MRPALERIFNEYRAISKYFIRRQRNGISRSGTVKNLIIRQHGAEIRHPNYKCGTVERVNQNFTVY